MSSELLLLVSIVDHLVMFRGRLMNPDRFPLIFRSVQFWLGGGAGERREFRPPKSQHLFPVKSSTMELNYGPRFAFYFPWRIETDVYSILYMWNFETISIFVTSGLNFFFLKNRTILILYNIAIFVFRYFIISK